MYAKVPIELDTMSLNDVVVVPIDVPPRQSVAVTWLLNVDMVPVVVHE